MLKKLTNICFNIQSKKIINSLKFPPCKKAVSVSSFVTIREVQTVNFGRIVESILGRQRAPTLVQKKFKNIYGEKNDETFTHTLTLSVGSACSKKFSWYSLNQFALSWCQDE